jgi:hypothetical protein
LRAILAILVAAAMAVLLPRLALAFFAYPSADDYCIVVETRQDGFWYMQVHSYLTWTGRYSAVFLESIVSQFDLAAVYRWFAAATIVATIAALRALVAALFEHDLSRARITAIAVIAAAVVAGGLPSGVEAFYWMPGAASYQWGVISYLAWLSLLIRTARRDDRGRGGGPWRRLLLVVMTVIVPGFNEVMAPIVLATILVFVAASRWQRLESGRFMLMLLGIAIVCTAIMLAAPGNFMRSSVYPELASRHNLSYALAETARQTVRFIARYAAYPALWLGAVAAWWWVARARRSEFSPRRHVLFAAAALLALTAIVYLTLFPVYWEYGEVNYSGEGRTYNVTYVVLIATVLCVTGMITRPVIDRISARLQERPGIRTGIDVGLAVVLATLLVASSSTRSVYQALEAAPRYLEEELDRADVLRRPPNSGVVFVDKITVRPAGLFWGDLEADESHWINVCVANYYGLQGVRSRL